MKRIGYSLDMGLWRNNGFSDPLTATWRSAGTGTDSEPTMTSLIASPPRLPDAVRAHLGTQLQDAYSATVTESPPEQLLRLAEKVGRALDAMGGKVDPAFRDGLLAAIPNLRAFALSLTHNPTRADDLVQDAMMKAWQHRARFEPGTNLGAWLFTILRNLFYSEHRKRVREVEDGDGAHAARLTSLPDQVSRLDLQDMREAIARLPPEQGRALVMVAAEGMSYEEVAEVCGVAVGTIKSRVNRARVKLAEMLGYRDGDLDPDNMMQSAAAAGA